MDIFKIIGVGIIGASISVILKKVKPEYSMNVIILTGVILLAYIMTSIRSVAELIENLMEVSGLNNAYINIILKITGIAYLAEFAVNICKDVDETAIASKIELGSKVIIIVLSIPILSALLKVINQII